MRRADALSVFTNRRDISIMDNLSVFFLAEGEQSGDEVMARLTTFIRAARQNLDFAVYDMRFSDRLRAGGRNHANAMQLAVATSSRSAHPVLICQLPKALFRHRGR